MKKKDLKNERRDLIALAIGLSIFLAVKGYWVTCIRFFQIVGWIPIKKGR